MRSIRFRGGPYDGHAHDFPSEPTKLPLDLVWLVCEDSLSPAQNKEYGRHSQLTSVAVYTLVNSARFPHYTHSGSISAKEFLQALNRNCTEVRPKLS